MASLRIEGKKIVIVRIGKIGDMIMSDFAFKKIREKYPYAELMLITLPRNQQLLKYRNDFEIIRYFHKGFDIVTLLRDIRKFGPDLLLDFNDNPSGTSQTIQQWCGAEFKVGFAFDKNKKYLTHPIIPLDQTQTHITERLRKIPEAIGLQFTPSEIKPNLIIGGSEMNLVKKQITQANKENHPLIAVNISAGEKTRYWPVEKWWRLLFQIRKIDPKVKFILLAAPQDQQMVKDLATPFPSEAIILPAHQEFHHFASYISLSDLLISPDTSAIHIASAKDIPVLGLYPGIDWNFTSWYPIAKVVQTVKSPTVTVDGISIESVYKAYCHIRPDIKKIINV